MCDSFQRIRHVYADSYTLHTLTRTLAHVLKHAVTHIFCARLCELVNERPCIIYTVYLFDLIACLLVCASRAIAANYYLVHSNCQIRCKGKYSDKIECNNSNNNKTETLLAPLQQIMPYREVVTCEWA